MPRFRDAGPSAPLVVEYHACELPSPPADVSIVCDGHAPFKQNYTRFRSDAADGILPVEDLGDHGPLILAGFSEGCQGVRTQLNAGVMPDAVLAIDGIHASDPPEPWQIEPWRFTLERARRGECFFLHTTTEIPTFGYLSTRQMARILWGDDIEQRASAYELGGVACRMVQEGLAMLCLFDGQSAAAHVEQGRVILPAAIPLALEALSGGLAMPIPARPWWQRGLALALSGAIAFGIGYSLLTRKSR